MIKNDNDNDNNNNISFPYQRLSIVAPRLNSVLLQDSFLIEDQPK